MKNFSFTKKDKILIAIIASPFLLELVFFWNNDSINETIKSAEKTISLLFFPIFIIGYNKKIEFIRILKQYIIITNALLLFLFIRFVYLSPKFFDFYLKGKELWESGYEFTKSFGMHAPAVNLHVSFITVISFYFFVLSLKKSKRKLILYLLLLINSFLFVLIINTRLALMVSIIGIIIVLFFELYKNKGYYRTIKVALFSGLILASLLTFYISNNQYMKEKYTSATFAHMDKIQNLDAIENPEAEVYNALVTRITIWKTTLELISENFFIGVGSSDAKSELFNYYKETNQNFLFRNKLPIHNQFLTTQLMFGLFGLILLCFSFGLILFIGIRDSNPIIISFFVIFLLANLVDDFLIRFDGIVFYGLFVSLFVKLYLNKYRLEF